MKDDKGFSLVELVIVLAIMAVLGGAIFYSYTLMTGQYARECANNLSTALDKEKNYALARSASVDCYMEIVKNNNSYLARYYVPANAIATGTKEDPPGSGNKVSNPDDWVLAEELKLGKERVDITVSIDDGTEYKLDVDKSIKFIYNRTSGAMKGIVKSDVVTDGLPDIIDKKCTKITLLNGRKYEIEVYSATGKHVLSRVD